MFYGVGIRPSSFIMGGDHKGSHPDYYLDALGVNRALFLLFPMGLGKGGIKSDRTANA